MEEILHHLGCEKPCRQWDKLSTNRLSRISEPSTVLSSFDNFVYMFFKAERQKSVIFGDLSLLPRQKTVSQFFFVVFFHRFFLDGAAISWTSKDHETSKIHGSPTTIFHRLVYQPPFFQVKGLSSSKRNHHFSNVGWLSGNYTSILQTHEFPENPRRTRTSVRRNSDASYIRGMPPTVSKDVHRTTKTHGGDVTCTWWCLLSKIC